MRPSLTTFESFPLPVHNAEGLQFIEAKHGLAGFAVAIKLLQQTYASGGVLLWDERNRYLHAHRIGLSLSALTPVLEDLLSEGIFSAALFQSRQVLSSQTIQQEAQRMARRRKDFAIPAEYRLSEPPAPMSAKTPLSVDNSLVNGVNNPNSPYMCDKSDYNKDKEYIHIPSHTVTHTPPPAAPEPESNVPPTPASPEQNLFSLALFCQLFGCQPYPRLRQMWEKLSAQDHQAIGQHLPQYLKFNPNPRYRKRPINYLHPQHRFWEEPLIDRRPNQPQAEDRIMVFQV